MRPSELAIWKNRCPNQNQQGCQQPDRDNENEASLTHSHLLANQARESTAGQSYGSTSIVLVKR